MSKYFHNFDEKSQYAIISENEAEECVKRILLHLGEKTHDTYHDAYIDAYERLKIACIYFAGKNRATEEFLLMLLYGPNSEKLDWLYEGEENEDDQDNL